MMCRRDYYPSRFLKMIFMLLLLTVSMHAICEEVYIARDPNFAEKVAFTTGILGPSTVILISLPLINLGDPPSAFLWEYSALIIPPLGNIYADNLNLPVAILYGIGVVCGSASALSYYSRGWRLDNFKNDLELALSYSAIVARMAAGLWDWLTATESAKRTNMKHREANAISLVTTQAGIQIKIQI